MVSLEPLYMDLYQLRHLIISDITIEGEDFSVFGGGFSKEVTTNWGTHSTLICGAGMSIHNIIGGRLSIGSVTSFSGCYCAVVPFRASRR